MTRRAQDTSKEVDDDVGEDDVTEHCVEQEPIQFRGGGGSRGTPTRETEGKETEIKGEDNCANVYCCEGDETATKATAMSAEQPDHEAEDEKPPV